VKYKIKSIVLINEISQFLAYGRPFFSQICKYLHYLKSQKYKIWCPSAAFLKESIGATFIQISAIVWEL
jgi:hypothetical protein